MQNCKGSVGSRMGSSHCCTLMYFCSFHWLLNVLIYEAGLINEWENVSRFNLGV